MKKLLFLLVLGVIFTSCQKEEFEIETNYNFKMTGRTSQDINEYLPTQVIWRCNAFWYTPDTLGYMYVETQYIDNPWDWNEFTITGYEGMTVPIVNGTSHADPSVDSVFCMMAPIGAMVGDTVTIYGQAWFEEGDVVLEDNINIIFE